MIEKYLNERYEFKYNEILNRTFFKEKESTSEFKLLKNYKLNSIKRELTNNDISSTQSDLKCLLESDYVPKYNPFNEYFENLPIWDKKTDYISQLIQTVKTTNQEDFAWAVKKWLVALVACAIDEETTNQGVLILTGAQGLGKTTWLKKLVPDNLYDYFFSGNINPNNKDTTLLMCEKFLINMDEMASLNKKQIESFKEMITKSMISERRAYAHFSENYVRRASFVGSSNHNELLMDVTGNRRFLCFEAIEIDYEHNINMDLVYSQVMHILREGEFRFHFEKEDIQRLEENNKMYIQSCEEMDWIEELFSVANENDEIHYMNATEIVSYIKRMKNIYTKIDIQQIGKIMTSKGFLRKKIKGSSKYIVSLN
ncbi:MAG TPA: VapE family protein [Flavobacterium sp.]|uniref:VapE domain-containing protein n=1 Tax=Flavobacterium sp. TaxID=239 RepID=UPI002B7212D5|nr:VapE domain-containing protein [Flavobacterium sp.]HNP31797.1 VapE family protein [Flavobacterium sp.]